MHHAGRELLLADLRTRIERLEQPSGRSRPVLPFGVPVLDRHLPAAGLHCGAVHEVLEAGATNDMAAPAVLFAAGIAARLKGPVLWCLQRRDLFAPGLASVGLHPDRLVFAETWRETDVLPAMEEGLREAGLAAVVGEVHRLGLTPSRRLQLAAERSGVMALVIRRWRQDIGEEPSVAATRWRVTPLPSLPLRAPGIGRARWHLDLLRCKGAAPRSWTLEACDETGRLALPAELAHGSHPQEGRGNPTGQAARDRETRRRATGHRGS